MSRLIGTALLVLVVAMSNPASALEPERAGQEDSLKRAVFADRRLWVLSDAGVLSNIAEDRGTQVRERLLEPVLDLCVQDGHPLIVTGKRQDGHEWTLLRRAEGRWSVRAVVRADSDYLIALDCAADRVTLLTTRRLVDVGKTRQSAVVLSGKLQAGRGADLQEDRGYRRELRGAAPHPRPHQRQSTPLCQRKGADARSALSEASPVRPRAAA
jgi:hypothetical protein